MTRRRMGMLEVPHESRSGMAGKRGPNVLDKVIKWRKAKPSKSQQEFKREVKKSLRGAGRMLKEIYNGDDGF